MRISDWSSDVCSSDLRGRGIGEFLILERRCDRLDMVPFGIVVPHMEAVAADFALGQMLKQQPAGKAARFGIVARGKLDQARNRSEEHTSELPSLMRISYAVFRLKQTTKRKGRCH